MPTVIVLLWLFVVAMAITQRDWFGISLATATAVLLMVRKPKDE